MGKNDIINLKCFGETVGKVGFDEQKKKSFFQYNPSFLEEGKYRNLFPDTGIIKRVSQTQVFSRFNDTTFRGLPPQIADSLPDMFGNLIFKTWLENSESKGRKISVLEQLAYVANRGMGALEYHPHKEISRNTDIDLQEIIEVLQLVLNSKRGAEIGQLNSEILLNIFKIGTSAGGARPKILISEHKKTGQIIPGDLEYSNDYHHYLIKLALEDNLGYPREVIEYSYYLTAQKMGINMMPSKLIEGKHFCTQRFDRQDGKKRHILTASGLTGWDFKSPEMSSYENLFDLSVFLKIPHFQIEELFKRMVFNIVFANTDDHLKNHSFIYQEDTDNWILSPAYDLTYALNPLLSYKKTSRALSVNGKRNGITRGDIFNIADKFTIKNATGIIEKVISLIDFWEGKTLSLGVGENLIKGMKDSFVRL
ncbi:MAG: serine/threonine-protein kinase HipA [Saprospiraceae bacterium]|jgi:serine/threonine-protein kinase HipA